MKIAIYHNLTSGGSKREMYEFIKKMKKHNHSVYVYTTSLSDEKFLPSKNIADEVFIYNLKFIQDIKFPLPLLRKYINLLSLFINLVKLNLVSKKIAFDINSKKYDFVFVHHCQIVQSPLLLRYLTVPSFYYCAEPMRIFYESFEYIDNHQYIKSKNFIDKLQRLWYYPVEVISNSVIKKLDADNVKYASRLVTNSYFSAESIKKAYGLNAGVCYLGVDTEKFVDRSFEKENFIVSVGALSPLKGYDFIIRSIALIEKDKRPDFIVVCNTVSTGEKNYLNVLAKNSGVSFFIKSNISDNELVEIYNKAIALVYSPHLEPFGFVPLEAMSCGLPIIAVKEGGVRESVKDGETGFLVERDAEKFKNALLEVMNNINLRTKFSENAKKYVREYWTWDKSYESLMKIIKNTLDK
jgi:glycosyltransferase involved in cell wall biosynthesis